MAEQTTRLRMENISKTFPGVKAVRDVTLEAYPGEILALVGENGAGKTTLMNILTGAIQADSGKIFLDGQEVAIGSPRQAQELGITIIHQELALISQMTVGQNIFLGREPRRAVKAMIDWEKMYAQAEEGLKRLGIDIPVRAEVGDLSISQRQLVEIAKALSYQARLIVLDEPTSALTDREAEVLFSLMRSLRDQGVTLIYISHRMEEVFSLSDRIAVMRDGQLVGAGRTAEYSPADVVRLMVGRELTDFFPKVESKRGEVVLEARNLCAGKMLRNASIQLAQGEIVGVAGLVGAGRTNLARALFGADRLECGEIWMQGRKVHVRSPQDAIRLGIGLVPEDRKAEGLFIGQSVKKNAAVGLYNRLATFGFLDFGRIQSVVRDLVQKLRVRTPSLGQRVGNLSGGNQQKVVIARWLALNPKVLILDEPTRGVDVGAKAEIHALISELAQQGVAILMISSELPEVLGVSDRVLVMREGEIVAEFSRAEATQDVIMQAATGQLGKMPFAGATA